MKCVFALSALLASAALGDTVQFQSLPINTQYGTYNGFVVATVNGVDIRMVCDDYDHTTYVPSGPLGFQLSMLTGPEPLQYARFVNPVDWDRSVSEYRQAAYLVSGMAQQTPGSPKDVTADYQYALWSLFTPSTPLPSSTAKILLDQSAAAVSGGQIDPLLYSRLRIYTPVQPYQGNQEFLALADPLASGGQQVPEPSTPILFACGAALIALSGLLHRRLRRDRGA